MAQGRCKKIVGQHTVANSYAFVKEKFRLHYHLCVCILYGRGQKQHSVILPVKVQMNSEEPVALFINLNYI